MLSYIWKILQCFFCLYLLLMNGVFGDEVKSVSVMEGDSVTLNTDLTHIQRDDHILWQFGPNSTRIAQIIKEANLKSLYNVNDERFRDRLKLDSQTGSLIITNIRITNSGLYKLQIISDRETSYKRFNVTVYAHLSVPVIIRNSTQCSSSSCVFVCSAMNVSHVTLSWYKGNSLLSNISVSDLNIRLSLSLEVEYQDTNTYSCVINNPIRNHTQHLNITDVCQMCSEHSSYIALTVIIGLLVIFVTAGVCCYHYRKHQRPTRAAFLEEQDIHYAEPICARGFHDMDIIEADHTEYSTVKT